VTAVARIFGFTRVERSLRRLPEAGKEAVAHRGSVGRPSRILREYPLLGVDTVEHGDTIDPNVVKLAQDADLLIHDAQYTPEELKGKKGWGHSSWEQAIEVALQAKAKKLALFHHDPDHDDSFLLGVEKECQKMFANAILAREGMVIKL